MPELPEVHTIVRDLKREIVGSVIRDCEITERYIALPSNDTFKNTVCNQRITDVERVAKNILIHLENKRTIHFHLAMTGQILLKEYQHFSFRKWLRVLLELEKENYEKYLIFNDMRMFGRIAVIGEKQLKELYDKYGPEPIDEKLTALEFLNRLKSKNTNVKNALLDQSLISGMGNIYATDALYLAGIHPEYKTQNLTTEQAEKLLEASQNVLKESILNRGSTLSDGMYVDIYGNEGNHQHHFKIYGKEICEKCQTKTEFKRINGRGTYFCPKCQSLSPQKTLF